MNINIIEKGGDKKTPHLAICHTDQGGSANNRHVSLLMKSKATDVVLSKATLAAIEKFGVQNFSEEIQKAFSANTKRALLQGALKEDYADSDEWLYVEDYTDTMVVFSVCDCDSYKLLQTTYEIDDATAKVTVGGSAVPVIAFTEYMVTEGKIEISETVEDRLESGMYQIVQKAMKRIENEASVMDILKATKKKKEGDVYLTAADYAYVPDENKTSTWKLRIDDAEHAKLAAQALSPEGLMGNKVEIPKADMSAVKKKVKAAYKKFYPDASKETLDSLFKASDIFSNSEVNLDIQELMKSSDFQELLKAQLEAAQAPLKEELEKAKAKAAEAEEILKAAEVVARQETVEFVKSASFVEDNIQETLVDFLMKSRKTEEHNLVTDIIKSAKTAIEKANTEVAEIKEKFALSETGRDGKVDLGTTSVEDLTKAKEFIDLKAEQLFKKESK